MDNDTTIFEKSPYINDTTDIHFNYGLFALIILIIIILTAVLILSVKYLVIGTLW